MPRLRIIFLLGAVAALSLFAFSPANACKASCADGSSCEKTKEECTNPSKPVPYCYCDAVSGVAHCKCVEEDE